MYEVEVKAEKKERRLEGGRGLGHRVDMRSHGPGEQSLGLSRVDVPLAPGEEPGEA